VSEPLFTDSEFAEYATQSRFRGSFQDWLRDRPLTPAPEEE